MSNSELGTKRTCPETGRKFYDLGKSPIVSPYTQQSYPVSFFEAVQEKPEPKKEPVAKPAAKPAEKETEEENETADVEIVSLEDADDETKGSKSKADSAAADDEADAVLDDDEDDDDSLSDDEDDNTFLATDDDEDDDDVSVIIGVGNKEKNDT